MVSPSATRSFKNNELIINYHDAVIYGSDLRLIERRTDWLNDSCINFFFTLLQRQLQSRTDDSNDVHRSILFMDPSVVSFWMHQCIDQDEIDDFVRSSQFPGQDDNRDGFIFIAVNDSMSTRFSSSTFYDSGTHWSLLVAEVASSERQETGDKDISKRTLRFSHFDSIGNSGNILAAEDIAYKIYFHFYPQESIITTSSGGMVHQVETPQQQNGYDCGIHVLGAAKILSKYLLSMESSSDKDIRKTRRLQDFEKSLRKEIGNDSETFCSKLRDEISSEIRHLHNS